MKIENPNHADLLKEIENLKYENELLKKQLEQQPIEKTNFVSNLQLEEIFLATYSLDIINDNLFLIDENARFFYVNEAACKRLKYTRKELTQLTVFDIDFLFPKSNWEEHWKEVQLKGITKLETIHQTSDGESFPVEIIANRIEYDGKIYHCAIARDISEMKNIQRKLTAAQYSLEQANIGIFWTDFSSNILYTNHAVCEMLGYSKEELCKMKIIDLDTNSKKTEDCFSELQKIGQISFETIHLF